MAIRNGVGLLAIIGAWVNGALFVGNGGNGTSFGMAMAAALLHDATRRYTTI